jgi:hypothetical protein
MSTQPTRHAHPEEHSMKQLHSHEKHPICVVDFARCEATCGSVYAMVAHLKTCIANTPRMACIGSVDRRAHTQAIGGEIHPAIQGEINVLFC